jgi:hypothetical protein
MKPIFQNSFKWLWISAVLISITVYFFENQDSVIKIIEVFSLKSILIAGVLILIAKFLFVSNVFLATQKFDINLTWTQSFHIYNHTQLGKYIPGFIWQFVGRYEALRQRGKSKANIRDSIIAEHFWVLLSAFCLSFMILSISNLNFIFNLFEVMDIRFELFILMIMMIIISLIYINKYFNKDWLKKFLPSFEIIIVTIAIWFFLGSALWVTILNFTEINPPFLHTVAVYSLGYAIGFLAFFAPAGIGIREAVITLSIIPYVTSEEAIIISAINRILYLFIELVLVTPNVLNFHKIEKINKFFHSKHK